MEQIFSNTGMGIESIILLLLLPITATFIGISRHVIGFKSLGIYLSLVLVYIFYQLGSISGTAYSDPITGLKYGIFLVIIIFLSAAFSYQFFRRWSIHYYPKLAMVLVNVTLILLILMTALGYFNISNVIKINAFTLVLIASVSEKYVSILTRKKITATLILTTESLVQAIICYLIISIQPFIDFLIKYPYIILVLYPINYFVGKFAGLRISEYFRFKKILDRLE